MAELSNIAAQLSKGKNIDFNLPKYTAGLTALYKTQGYVKLALNLFAFAEVYGEELAYTDTVKSYADRLGGLVKEAVLSPAVTLNVIDSIDTLRNELIANMEILTAYADRLRIFEYVLNRVEYNFNECDVNLDYYDEKFEKDILNFIVSDKDNSVVNMKISQTVSQLPMRLSKNKFFELLRQGFSIYNGSDVNAVNDYTYMIRSVAMLETPDGFESRFVDLYNFYTELKGFDYTEMTADSYNQAFEVFEEAREHITNLTDIYVLMMDAVNSLYSLALADNALVDADAIAHCITIISGANEAILKKELPTEEQFEHFVAIEGVLEKVSLQISKDGYALDDIRNSMMDKVVSLGEETVFECLEKLELLNSGSNFMKLSKNEDANILADDAFITAGADHLCEELSQVFASNPRCINRAVMAAVLGQLPVFFNNLEEIKAYIHVALGQCKDEAEKKACMKLMLSLMNE